MERMRVAVTTNLVHDAVVGLALDQVVADHDELAVADKGGDEPGRARGRRPPPASARAFAPRAELRSP